MRQNSGAAEAQIAKGRVVIRLPRNWYAGKLKFLALGLPESPENLAYGEKIAGEINYDFAFQQFDHTLAKYKPQKPQQQESIDLTIAELWRQYCAYKSPSWKAKTKDYYQVRLGAYVDRMPQDWQQPLTVRTWLLENTSQGMTVRILKTLCTVLDWAIRCRLIPDQPNPFDRMGNDLGRKSNPSPANAFTPAEERLVIEAFYASEVWNYYGSFVEFLFLSGCRPSEAVGLHWEQISPDFKTIRFDRSIVKIGGEYKTNHLSKTNRFRNFPSSDQLTRLLTDLKAQSKPGLVFRGLEGKPINYENLLHQWPKIVEPIIGRKSTPYSCRDTFITRQISQGKPPAVVAKWVDNSVSMIERKYLDIDAIQTIRPD